MSVNGLTMNNTPDLKQRIEKVAKTRDTLQSRITSTLMQPSLHLTLSIKLVRESELETYHYWFDPRV
jgi:hypothetical protein